jgi:histidine triad (HIT) family protein
VLPDEPAVPGHIILLPKRHLTIFEECDDTLARHVFDVAQKLSSVLFDSIGAEGTNILIHNGTPAGQEVAHFSVNIIPRRKNDGLDFDWTPKKIGESELSSVVAALKEGLAKMSESDKTFKEKKEDEKKKERSALDSDEVNYLVKQLRRTP